MTTPSVSTPKDQAREDARVEKGKRAHHAHALELAAARLKADGRPANADSCLNAAAYLRALPSPADPVRAALEEVALIQARELARLAPNGETPADLDIAMQTYRAALSVSTPTGEGEEPALTILEVSECGGAKVKMPIGMGAATVRWNLSGEETVEYVSESAMSLLNAAALAHPQQRGERDGMVSLPSEEELGEIIHEAVCSHNDMDEVHWYYVARDVARALRKPVPTAPTSPSKSSGEEATTSATQDAEVRS